VRGRIPVFTQRMPRLIAQEKLKMENQTRVSENCQDIETSLSEAADTMLHFSQRQGIEGRGRIQLRKCKANYHAIALAADMVNMLIEQEIIGEIDFPEVTYVMELLARELPFTNPREHIKLYDQYFKDSRRVNELLNNRSSNRELFWSKKAHLEVSVLRRMAMALSEKADQRNDELNTAYFHDLLLMWTVINGQNVVESLKTFTSALSFIRQGWINPAPLDAMVNKIGNGRFIYDVRSSTYVDSFMEKGIQSNFSNTIVRSE